MSSAKSDCIAIVGMSCIFPGAESLSQFWSNIESGVDSLREPSASEWDAVFYKNKSESQFGRIYCSKAGFITEYANFNPLDFGIMPASLRGADPDQFLALRVAAEALLDAGYSHKNFNGERADIVIGRTMAPGVGSLNLIQHGQTIDQVLAALRVVNPGLSDADYEKISAALHKSLEPCNADTIPAVMPNVLSGRIASKLGFRGRNLVLDAACASSLVAVETIMQGLLAGSSDLGIAGGIHVNSSPYFSQMFCELGALSSNNSIRPFDEAADGTMLGEGVGMVVLKRYADALRDGNKIYALIKGIGSSSDGRGSSSLAPSEDGEALAMNRAYSMAGVSPLTVGLYEAHGTGTKAGDKAEMKAVQIVFNREAAKVEPWCALGSVKTNIGHTQAASGIAGLIKAALALHYKVIPPAINFSKPSSQIDWDKSPCYLSSEKKAWVLKSGEHPRRAAISAFGFGGVNSHAVLEEFVADASYNPTPLVLPKVRSAKSIRLNLRYPELSLKGLEQDFQSRSELRADAVSGADQKQASSLTSIAKPGSLARARIDIKASAPIETQSAAPASPAVVRQKVSQLVPPAVSSTQNQIIESVSVTETNQDEVMVTYLQTVGSFQKNLLNVQEQVLMQYLSQEEQ